MSEITPADLAKFIYPVPEGATIPAGTEYVLRRGANLCLVTLAYDRVADNPFTSRWTAEPIPAPEPTLAERARAVGDEFAPGGRFEQLAIIVAELAERIEADR